MKPQEIKKTLNLYLIAGTCISLAERMIKVESLRSHQSYHEAFDIKILDPDFLGRLPENIEYLIR